MNGMERLSRAGVVPVVVIEDSRNAVPTARALLAGGIDVMEVTLRTDAALDAIRAIRAECPEVLVGAGTVVNAAQCRACVEAGAQFVVSPGFDAELVQSCVQNSVPVVPGCVTPTEIMAAMRLGLRVVKFFPADVYGGLRAMKALAGPFGAIRFMPTGGVNAENLEEYLAAPFIAAVGGSWVCTKAAISGGEFEKITALARQATQMVARVRGAA